jgi:exoribonuclease R
MAETVVSRVRKAKKSRVTKSPKTPKVKGKRETIAKQTTRNHERKKKEVTEKAETIIRKGNAQERALEMYHQLQRLGLTPYFDSATIDLHRERPSVVFIPKTETIVEVENGQLLDFLKGQGVQRILVDAQFPNNAEVLSEINKAGIEVYLLKRTTTLSAFRKSLENKHDLSVPKNDYNDAILLAFVKPKFWKQVDWRYIECWNYMVLWRDAEKEFRRFDNRIKTYPKLRQDKEVMSQFEEVQVRRENAARTFIQVVQSFYPEIDDLFQRLGIEKDPIAKAYCCEIILEMQGYRKFKWFLKKAGIGFPLPTLLKSRQGRKVYIYDKRLRHALHQLMLKVYHLNPYENADRRKIQKKMFKLVKRIWNWWQRQRMMGDGRVGEALGVAGPSRKGRGLTY